MGTISAHAGPLAGLLVPVITQLVKKVLPCSGRSAQALSLLVAVGAVAAAHAATGQSLALPGLVSDSGLAWAVSQVVYEQVQGTPAAGILLPGK